MSSGTMKHTKLSKCEHGENVLYFKSIVLLQMLSFQVALAINRTFILVLSVYIKNSHIQMFHINCVLSNETKKDVKTYLPIYMENGIFTGKCTFKHVSWQLFDIHEEVVFFIAMLGITPYLCWKGFTNMNLNFAINIWQK